MAAEHFHSAEHFHWAIVTFLDEIWSSHRVLVYKDRISNLKLHAQGPEISEVTKLCTLQLMNISLSTWMSSEALRIAMLIKKKVASLAFDLRNFD